MNSELKVICGDCVEKMRELPDESVQLVVTSPPYDSLRSYQGYKFDFESTAKELFRVVCEGGIICWNVGDSVVDGSETLTSFKQAIYFKEVCGFRVHDTMIYEKSNGSKPDATRYNPCFEYVFVITKGRPRCFNPIKDKPNVTFGMPCYGKHTMREKDGSMSVRSDRRIAAEFGTRSNVWKGNTRGQEQPCSNLDHPAMMPKWLARDLIKSFSNEGDTVLDPMCGSGTVPEMALEYNRNAIAIDISQEYCEMTLRNCHRVTPQLV